MESTTISWKNLSLTFFVTFLLGYLLNYICEQTGFFPLEQNDLSVFTNTVWQVQVSISTLPVAILALLISISNKKIYGLKVLQFLLINNRRFLAFQDEIILILLLNLLQYYFSANLNLASVGLIFFITIILVVKMVYSSVRILIFEEDVEKQIKKYIIHRCLKEIKIEEQEV